MTEIKIGRRRSLLGTTSVVITAALPAGLPQAAAADVAAAPAAAAAAPASASAASISSAVLGGKGKAKTRVPKPTSIKDYNNNPYLRPIGPVLNSNEQARLTATAIEVRGDAAN